MKGLGNPIISFGTIGGAIIGIIAILLVIGTSMNYVGNFAKGLEDAGNGYIFGAVIIIVIVVVAFLVKAFSKH